MKTTFLLFAFCIFFTACTPENKQEAPDAALQDDEVLSLTKTRKGDIIEALYEELKAQRPELKTLELQVEQVDQSQKEALKEYYRYNSKNEQYYTNAGLRINNIKDSLLKNSIELLLKKSQYAYDQKNAAMALAAATLENRSTILHDHQEALKITLTMNLIEKYQKQQLPNSSEYKKIMDRYNETIKMADSLFEAK